MAVETGDGVAASGVPAVVFVLVAGDAVAGARGWRIEELHARHGVTGGAVEGSVGADECETGAGQVVEGRVKPGRVAVAVYTDRGIAAAGVLAVVVVLVAGDAVAGARGWRIEQFHAGDGVAG